MKPLKSVPFNTIRFKFDKQYIMPDDIKRLSRKTQTDFRPLSIANFQDPTTWSNATVVEENLE